MDHAYYIQFSGLVGDIKEGEYKGWFLLSSLSFERSRPAVSSAPGGGRHRERPVDVKSILFTMESGAAAAMLMREAALGTSFKTVKIVLVAMDGKEQHPIFEIELKMAILSSLSVSNSGALSASLVFDQITQSARGGPPQVEVKPARRP